MPYHEDCSQGIARHHQRVVGGLQIPRVHLVERDGADDKQRPFDQVVVNIAVDAEVVVDPDSAERREAIQSAWGIRCGLSSRSRMEKTASGSDSPTKQTQRIDSVKRSGASEKINATPAICSVVLSKASISHLKLVGCSSMIGTKKCSRISDHATIQKRTRNVRLWR